MKRSELSMMMTLHAAAAALIVALFPALSLAQLTSEQSATAQSRAQEEAAERFERGIELYNDGALEAAVIEFERAYELTRDYRVLYNLARVQMERHRYVESIRIYERYLKDGSGEISPERREEVKTELETLKRRVAHLWVESNVTGAELFVNDVSVGTLPLVSPLLINPGTSQIRLEKAGYETTSQDLKVAGGDSPRLILNLVPRTAAPSDSESALPVSAPSRRTHSRPNRTPFWISAGTTVALGAAAGTFGVLVLNNRGQLDEEYDEYPLDRARIDDLQNRGRTYAIVADALTGAAIIGAGVSLYFLISPPKKKTTLGLRDVRLSPHLGGATLSGHF